jgi:hypothetical protein
MNNEIELLRNIIREDNSFCIKIHLSCIPENLSNLYIYEVKNESITISNYF